MDATSYLLGKKNGGTTPTGTISITENGESNVTNYATANVNVQPDLESKSITITENKTTTISPTQGKDGLSSVEVITNVSGGPSKSLADVNKALDGYYDYLNDLPSSYETITSDNVVLYTPSQDFTTYYITKTGNVYRIAWTKPSVGISKESSGTNAGKFGVQINTTTGELIYAQEMIEFYRDKTFTGYYSLEEAINALKNSSTEYNYYSSNYISLAEGDYIVTNGFAVNTTTDEPRLCKKISQNETIQTI